MNLFTKKTYEQYVQWVRGFSNESLVHYIEVFDRLFDNDDFCDSLVIDEAIKISDILRDECVYRISTRYLHDVQILDIPSECIPVEYR